LCAELCGGNWRFALFFDRFVELVILFVHDDLIALRVVLVPVERIVGRWRRRSGDRASWG
jgi:hypothetical protein